MDNLTQARQQAHAYLDRLPGEQLAAVHDLLESMLAPLDRKLAQAPLDDEPLLPEEAAAIQEGVAFLDRNGGVPMQEVLADFGLTMDDFRKMAGSPESR